MQKTESSQLTTAHRRVQGSTTLNRKYVRKPVKTSSATSSVVKQQANKITTKQSSPVANQNAVRVRQQRVQARTVAASGRQQRQLTASELKELAIKKALQEANDYSEKEESQGKLAETIEAGNTGKKSSLKKSGLGAKKAHFGIGRVLLALGCAAAAVVAIVYFVNANMPDISLKVAAMQTGIDNPYPSYVPRDYNTSDVVSENGKITISFKNPTNGGSFTLVEERSSWDSGALLSNYVKEAYKDDYTVVREQGLTLYIGRYETAWVNGGVFYKLKLVSGALTKKQIRSIAVSL